MEVSGEFSKDMRRMLRKKLKEDLLKIQGLSSKLEARALQILQSRSVPVHPSFSDAQFSGNDMPPGNAGGKEVTSQLNLMCNGSDHHTAQLTKQRLFPASSGTPVEADLLVNKRTPKASQVYNRSEFLLGKDKLPPPVRSSTKPTRQDTRVLGMSGGQKTRMPNRGYPKQKLSGMPNEYKVQCRSILKKLIGHEDGWIFNEPVDAVKLGLSDYHSCIKKPMDLGTIKTKLEKKNYTSLPEFADDVRLTFNNAMTYNPPGNDVHQSAKVLLAIFQKDWDVLIETLERTDGEEVDGVSNSLGRLPEVARASTGGAMSTLKSKSASLSKISTQKMPSLVLANKSKLPLGKTKAFPTKLTAPTKRESAGKSKGPFSPEAPVKPKDVVKAGALAKPKTTRKPKALTNSTVSANPQSPQRSIKSSAMVKASEKSNALTKGKANSPTKVMSYEEKVRLQTILGQLPQQTLEELILLIKERNINMNQEGDEIEVDLDSFDDDTLWELDRRANECFSCIRTESESKKRHIEKNSMEKTGKKQKGFPGVTMENRATSGNKSSSESGSSSDSDSGSSSTSDSDG